jgi:hypothetical protein
MAIIRAEATGYDTSIMEDLVKNPFVEFAPCSSRTCEGKQRTGFILRWRSEGFEDEVKTSIRILQANEPWLQEISSGDWNYGPQLELFGEPGSSFVLPKLLLDLAVQRGLDIHVRIVLLEDPDLLDMIERWLRSPGEYSESES